MRFAILAAAALMLAACQPQAADPEVSIPRPTVTRELQNATPAECATAGGTMRPVGRAQTMQCVVAYADVYGGEEPSVPLVGSGAIDIFVPKGAKDCPQATITYQGPLRPPVEQGTQVAQLNVICGGTVVQTAPLFAGESVVEGNIVRKATDALKQLALGWL